MKCKLIGYTQGLEKVVAMAGKLCYSPVGIDELEENLTEEKIQTFIKNLVDMGHESPLEHCSFTFAIEGISRACYDKDTEVYTDQGWKYFKNLNGSEKILSRNQDGTSIFEKPLNYIRYHFKGQMHKYKSQNIDLCITPNHKIFMKKYDTRTEQQYELIASEDISVNRFYTTKEIIDNKKMPKVFVIPEYSYLKKLNNGKTKIKTLPQLQLDSKEFIKFLAWYLSEGSVYYNEKENSYTISISQSSYSDTNVNNIEDIKTIIKNLGFTPNYDGRSIKFKNSQLGLYLKALGKSYEKYIPNEIFNFINKELALLFIETYEKADGTIDKSNCSKLFTTSKELSDQLQMISFIAGYTGKIHIDNRIGESHYSKKCGNTITHNHICYVLNISKNKRNRNPIIKRDKHMQLLEYDDEVYCVEVPNHVIFIRRNGCCLWCGNCSHQIVRHRIASYSQQSQRYVKEEEGKFEFITPDVIIAMGDDAMKEYEQDMLKMHKMYLKWQSNIKQFVEDTDYPTYGMNSTKVANENARYVLPNASETKIIVSMNVRSLYNFFSKRLCHRAQSEIRQLAELMLKECKEVCPTLFSRIDAPCVYGVCPEGKLSCGTPKK